MVSIDSVAESHGREGPTHFAMSARGALLDATVAADSDDDAIVADEGSADRYAGLLESLLGLENGVPDVLQVKVGRV